VSNGTDLLSKIFSTMEKHKEVSDCCFHIRSCSI
jgi:hypothetical protein